MRGHNTNCACTSRVCRPREDDARCDSPRLEFDQVVLRFAIASRSRRPRRPRGPRAEERFCGPTTIPYFRLWASRLCVLFVWCPCRRGHSTPGARTPSQRSGLQPTLLDGGFFLREAKIPSHHSAEGRASSAHLTPRYPRETPWPRQLMRGRNNALLQAAQNFLSR